MGTGASSIEHHGPRPKTADPWAHRQPQPQVAEVHPMPQAFRPITAPTYRQTYPSYKPDFLQQQYNIYHTNTSSTQDGNNADILQVHGDTQNESALTKSTPIVDIPMVSSHGTQSMIATVSANQDTFGKSTGSGLDTLTDTAEESEYSSPEEPNPFKSAAEQASHPQYSTEQTPSQPHSGYSPKHQSNILPSAPTDNNTSANQDPEHYSNSTNHSPEIGFKSDIVKGISNNKTMAYNNGRPVSAKRPALQRPMSARWDTKRDRVFMMVLSADEFLARMEETDEEIRRWSTCEDEELRYRRNKELLGLRGHLQDELLRIEAMLAEEDPQLEGLRHFEGEWPHVVERLRELNKRHRCIQIQTIDIDIDDDDDDNDSGILSQTSGSSFATAGTQMTPRSTGHVIGSQTEGQGHEIAVGDDGEEIIDENLREKFVQEENHVTDDFAQRMASRGLSKEDVDRLLSDHALSMQALRKKQNLEKEKYRQMLEAKKRERLLQRRGQQGSPGPTQVPSPKQLQSKKSGDFFFIDFSSGKGKGDKGKNTKPGTGDGPQKDKWGPQSGWFYVDMDGNTSQDGGLQKKNSQTQINSTQKSSGTNTESGTSSQQTNTSPQSKPVGVATRISSGNQGTRNTGSTDSLKKGQVEDKGQGHRKGSVDSQNDSDEDLENKYDDDFEKDSNSSSGEEKEELKATLKEDLWTTLEDEGGMSKQMFQELLGAYKDQEEGRKAIREAEGLKHKSSFLAKLAERQKKKGPGSHEMDTQTESAETSNSASSTEDPFQKELEEIKKKDAALLKNLLKKRKDMTDKEFQELLKRHLADIESLRKKRAHDREKHDARLREKLRQRKSRKDAGGDSDDEDAVVDAEEAEVEEQAVEETAKIDKQLDRELTELENKLQNELKRRGRNLGEADLEELMEHYRRQQEALVNRRKGEKEKINDRLKAKLAEKKQQRPDAGEDDDEGPMDGGVDDSFFQYLQNLKNKGKLTEEKFSSMLKVYLDQVDEDKRETRKNMREERRKTAEVDRNVASTLVQESQQQSKQIQGIRQREKDKLDQSLQKKLQAKRNKKDKTAT